MDPLTIGLGASGTGGVVLIVLYYLVRKGLKSKCIVGGHEIKLEIRRAASDASTSSPDHRTDRVEPRPTEAPSQIRVVPDRAGVGTQTRESITSSTPHEQVDISRPPLSNHRGPTPKEKTPKMYMSAHAPVHMPGTPSAFASASAPRKTSFIHGLYIDAPIEPVENA